MTMKKLLLTSALVAGVSSAALANGLEVKVGGFVNFRASFFNQDINYETASSAYDKTNRMNTTTRVIIKAAGKSDFGLAYGGSIWIDDNMGNTDGITPRIRSSSIFMESGLGKLELGMIDAPSRTMKVDATRITRGDGGIDTSGATVKFYNAVVGYINTSSGTTTKAKYITQPYLPLDHGTVITGRYNKLAYYTPEISGFQFGASYCTDTQEVSGLGNVQSDFQTLGSGQAQYDNLYYQNAFTLGAKYNYQLDQVAVSLGAVGQFADAKKVAVIPLDYQTIKAVRAYSLGATATYTNFTFAASYAYWGKSMNTAEPNTFQRADGRYYTAGVSYVQGPMGLSLTYMDSSRQKNKFSVTSVGADYQLAPGLLPYVEGNFFKFKPYTNSGMVYATTGGTGTAHKNKGNVVFVGTKLNF